MAKRNFKRVSRIWREWFRDRDHGMLSGITIPDTRWVDWNYRLFYLSHPHALLKDVSNQLGSCIIKTFCFAMLRLALSTGVLNNLRWWQTLLTTPRGLIELLLNSSQPTSKTYLKLLWSWIALVRPLHNVTLMILKNVYLQAKFVQFSISFSAFGLFLFHSLSHLHFLPTSHKEKVKFVSSPRTFKPGMKYVAYLKVSQQDGKPLLDAKKNLNVTYTIR